MGLFEHGNTHHLFHLINGLHGIDSLLEPLSRLEFLQFLQSAVEVFARLFAQHPRVCQRLVRSQSRSRVHIQQCSDEILGAVRDGAPVLLVEGEFSALNGLEQLLLVVIVEGRIATKQNVQNHAKGPHIHLRTVEFILQNLGRYVAGRTALFGDVIPLRDLREAEVDYFHICVIFRTCHQQVFWLQITMSNVLIVHVLDGIEQGHHQVSGFLLVVVRLLYDAVKQLAPADLLQHKVEVARLLEEVQGPNDVWVVQRLQDSHLLANCCLCRLVQVLARHALHCHFQLVHIAHRGLHHRISPLTQYVS
mmetsp:Transcript_21423/g.35849  ORF Transcript_21423/g.35849 Transcript_21423/m.35849 type:complete len:306 (-) Transcript_21423:419-1336(-)